MIDGSSPLARGLRRYREQGPAIGRIIPARAGFTLCAAPGPHGARDHPRSRGVYYLALRTGDWRDGSSPLARGLLPGRRPRRV